MARYDAAVISALTSAGAFVVTTRPALFYGICASGSAADTVINIHNGVTTAGQKVFMLAATATTVSHDGPYIGIVCDSGIVATNIGTVTNYAVFYSNLAR